MTAHPTSLDNDVPLMTSAGTAQWHCVAKLDQLDADFPTSLELDGQQVGLYVQDGEPHALEDICPHAYAVISQGFVEDGKVECPLHSAFFDIKTGKCLSEIGQRDLKKFPTQVRDGMVWIEIAPAA